jgi:hypothetical protein
LKNRKGFKRLTTFKIFFNDWTRRRQTKTRLGERPGSIAGLVEKTNLFVIAFLLAGGIVVCAGLFFVLSYVEHGIEPSNGSGVDFWDCLYFSVVTISSLGYGDFRPVGVGRIIATLEVIYGLIVIALFVAKIVSERQAALIRLIYSSDHERRIKEFRIDLKKRETTLDDAAKDHSHDEIKRLGKQTIALLGALQSYLKFQIHVGILAEVSGKGNMRGLLKCILNLTERASWIALRLPQSRADVQNVLEYAMTRGNSIAVEFIKHTVDDQAIRLCNRIGYVCDRYMKNLEKRTNQPGMPLPKGYTELTPVILDRIQAQLPDGPWPRDIHKTIASRLCLSNSLTHRAIVEILARGGVRG